MNLEKLKNLIIIRNHINNIYQGFAGGITKSNQKEIGNKILLLDNMIIKGFLDLDLKNLNNVTVTSTEFNLEEWRKLIENKIPVESEPQEVKDEQVKEDAEKQKAFKKAKISRST